MESICELDAETVHRICSNQVVLDLQGCVKELVENSIDAGATNIEIKFMELGSSSVEVIDNGCGIPPAMYAKVTSRHCTSKIQKFSDIDSELHSFGFRGEALSSICALADVSICTRSRTTNQKNTCEKDCLGELIKYDHRGNITERHQIARGFGTTVKVANLFKHLPVRHREFMRSIKTQLSCATRILQAFSMFHRHVKFHCVTEKSRSASKTVLLSTSGKARSLRSAVSSIFGTSWLGLQDVHATNDAMGLAISGLVSSPLYARRTRDNQFFYVNGRPVDLPKKMVKCINDLFRQFNSKGYPAIVLEFRFVAGCLDVNVTPDKRSFFVKDETAVIAWLITILQCIFSPKDRMEATQTNIDALVRPPICQPVGLPSVPARKSDLCAFDITDAHARASQLGSQKLSANSPVVKLKADCLGGCGSDTTSLTTKDSVTNDHLRPVARGCDIKSAGGVPDARNHELGTLSAQSSILLDVCKAAAPVLSSQPSDAQIARMGKRAICRVSNFKASISFFSKSFFSRRKTQTRQKHVVSVFCGPSFPSAFSLSHGHSVGDRDLIPFVFNKKNFLSMSVCGQFNHGFILACMKSSGSMVDAPANSHNSIGLKELFIIDQHAADEKKRFEELNKSSSLSRQPLAHPWRLRFNAMQEQIVLSHLEIFSANGFSIEVDGAARPGQRVLVKTLPMSEQHRGSVIFTEDDIFELIEILKAGGAEYVSSSSTEQQLSYRSFWGSTSSIPRPPKVWQVMASRACRGAIMIGSALRDSQMRSIVDQLAVLEQPWNCPHGRPTCRHVASTISTQRVHWLPPLQKPVKL